MRLRDTDPATITITSPFAPQPAARKRPRKKTKTGAVGHSLRPLDEEVLIGLTEELRGEGGRERLNERLDEGGVDLRSKPVSGTVRA